MRMKPVVLEELVSPGCAICRQFETFWQSIAKDWPNVAYMKVDILAPEGQQMAQKYMIFASPGIVLNGELWATGGFDKKKFIEKLRELSA
ncbi:MAG: thioredoxin family protein [Patescibacteria group bacterium]